MKKDSSSFKPQQQLVALTLAKYFQGFSSSQCDSMLRRPSLDIPIYLNERSQTSQ